MLSKDTRGAVFMSNGPQPRFKIVEYAISGLKGPTPYASRVVEDGITDLQEAKNKAEKHSKAHPKNGYNDEEDYWWGRGDTPAIGRVFYTVESS
jgi:hypothetical protein